MYSRSINKPGFEKYIFLTQNPAELQTNMANTSDKKKIVLGHQYSIGH